MYVVVEHRLLLLYHRGTVTELILFLLSAQQDWLTHFNYITIYSL